MACLPQASPEDEAILFYTSGTTGPPKGVPLTKENIAMQIDVLLRAELVNDDDCVLLPLPLRHVYPLVNVDELKRELKRERDGQEPHEQIAASLHDLVDSMANVGKGEED